jgi:hypothetical protein
MEAECPMKNPIQWTCVSILMLAAMTVGAMAVAPAAQGSQQQERVDFSTAATAEVRDAQNQVILSGQFVAAENGDDIERTAKLAPTGIDADASGEAEVEVSGTGNDREQEVEFSVTNVQPGAVLTFLIDGRTFATVTADARGRAEHERDVPLP